LASAIHGKLRGYAGHALAHYTAIGSLKYLNILSWSEWNINKSKDD